MQFCQLCGQDKALRNSHIIPEFLYKNIYNHSHKMMGVDGFGGKGYKLIQKGIREPMFCDDCEQHINKNFENPFNAFWFDEHPLPDPFTSKDIHWISTNYAKFKLFHLSIFFRASLSSLPIFKNIQIGIHEDRIRKMLLSCDPGDSWQYPLMGFAVIHHETDKLIQMVSEATHSRYDGHRCYSLIYGGVQWWVCFSSHKNPEFERLSLQTNGLMPIKAISWNSIDSIQKACLLLNQRT